MELNKEVALLQNEIRKFAKEVIAEKADEFDKQAIFPTEVIKKLAEMGILGATIPESFGGCNLDTASLIVCLEEIARVCPATALVIATHDILFSYMVAKFGSPAMQSKYLPRAASGDFIGGFAEIQTNEISVMNSGNTFVVNGRNHILLNGITRAPFVCCVNDNNRFSILLVEENAVGITRNKKDNIIGMRAAGITELIFENCSISKENLLGKENEGKGILEEMTWLANLGFAAINLGICQAAMENALKYAKERIQFGEPIINFGMVRELISEMTTKIEALRLLVYDTAALRDSGKEFARSAAIARYFSNQSVAEITTNAIQVYGGYGYMKDYPVEKYFRDAQVSRVLCTPNIELQESIVSRTI